MRDVVLPTNDRARGAPGPDGVEADARGVGARRGGTPTVWRDVRVDDTGNVWARVRRGDGAAVVLCAHLDTVFAGPTCRTTRTDGGPAVRTGCRRRRRGGRRALGRGRPARPDAGTPVWLLATVGEEGLGNLRGVHGALDAPPEPVGRVHRRGGELPRAGLGRRRRLRPRWRVTVTGPGGHAWEAPDAAERRPRGGGHRLGDRSHVAGRRRHVRERRTDRRRRGASTRAPATAWFELDLRADDPRTLAALAARRRRDRGADRRTAPRRANGARRPAGGRLDPAHPLVRAAGDALREAGIDVRLVATSTDANAAHARGIPAIAVGITTGAGEHTPQEWIDIAPIAERRAVLARDRGAVRGGRGMSGPLSGVVLQGAYEPIEFERHGRTRSTRSGSSTCGSRTPRCTRATPTRTSRSRRRDLASACVWARPSRTRSRDIPAITAAAAATVDEISGGRMILGIGAGDRPLLALGLKPSSVASLRASIGAIRALWSGAHVSRRGRARSSCTTPTCASRRVPTSPSTSPRAGRETLELAGEVADGVILLVGLFPEALAWALEHVDRGAAKAGTGASARRGVRLRGDRRRRGRGARVGAIDRRVVPADGAGDLRAGRRCPPRSSQEVRARYAGGEFQEAAEAARPAARRLRAVAWRWPATPIARAQQDRGGRSTPERTRSTCSRSARGRMETVEAFAGVLRASRDIDTDARFPRMRDRDDELDERRGDLGCTTWRSRTADDPACEDALGDVPRRHPRTRSRARLPRADVSRSGDAYVQTLEASGDGVVQRFLDRRGPGSASRRVRGRRDRRRARRPATRGACVWSTSEARPGGMGTRIAFVHPSAFGRRARRARRGSSRLTRGQGSAMDERSRLDPHEADRRVFSGRHDRRKVTDWVYEEVREAIIDLRLQPGRAAARGDDGRAARREQDARCARRSPGSSRRGWSRRRRSRARW